MHFSTKGRFAVTAMIDLALRNDRAPVALVGISARQRMSQSYLEQLFCMLRRHGLVCSTRGPGGGYSLGRSARAISVADIVAAVDDASLAGARRGPADAAAPAPGPLDTRALWARLDVQLFDHLAAISLASLVEQQIANGVTMEDGSPQRAPPMAPAARPPKARGPNSVFAWGASLAATPPRGERGDGGDRPRAARAPSGTREGRG